MHIDLLPNLSLPILIQKLSQPKGKQSLANHLRKSLGIDGAKAGLLREILKPADFDEPLRLASLIKALPIRLHATRPLDEAISSSGGVAFDALDAQLMLRQLPGVFCREKCWIGKHTGGYLLSACFASGKVAGGGVLNWW